MVMKLNRDAFRQLIAEDLDWLNGVTRTLERDHVIEIVKESEYWHYDLPDLLNEVIAQDIGEALTKKLEALVLKLAGPRGD